jgi:hypothetical protein
MQILTRYHVAKAQEIKVGMMYKQKEMTGEPA